MTRLMPLSLVRGKTWHRVTGRRQRRCLRRRSSSARSNRGAVRVTSSRRQPLTTPTAWPCRMPYHRQMQIRMSSWALRRSSREMMSRTSMSPPRSPIVSCWPTPPTHRWHGSPRGVWWVGAPWCSSTPSRTTRHRPTPPVTTQQYGNTLESSPGDAASPLRLTAFEVQGHFTALEVRAAPR